MKNVALIYIIFFGLVAIPSLAQHRMLDVSVRGSVFKSFQMNEELYSREITAIGASAEVVFFPLKFVGVGGFFGKSVFGESSFNNNNINFSTEEKYADSELQQYGGLVQFTTNRNRVFRFYATAKYFNFQLREDYGEFAIYKKANAMSGGFGMHLKLSQSVSLNVFDLNCMAIPKKMSYTAKDSREFATILQAQMGITVKLLKKR